MSLWHPGGGESYCESWMSRIVPEGYSHCTWWGVRWSFILQPLQKIDEPEILHPQRYLARLNTSILIFSIKQTLRPKNMWQISWHKKYRAWGCKFSTPKNTSEPPVMHPTATTPLGSHPRIVCWLNDNPVLWVGEFKICVTCVANK